MNELINHVKSYFESKTSRDIGSAEKRVVNGPPSEAAAPPDDQPIDIADLNDTQNVTRASVESLMSDINEPAFLNC